MMESRAPPSQYLLDHHLNRKQENYLFKICPWSRVHNDGVQGTAITVLDHHLNKKIIKFVHDSDPQWWSPGHRHHSTRSSSEQRNKKITSIYLKVAHDPGSHNDGNPWHRHKPITILDHHWTRNKKIIIKVDTPTHTRFESFNTILPHPQAVTGRQSLT
jgi:hypothetical protein